MSGCVYIPTAETREHIIPGKPHKRIFEHDLSFIQHGKTAKLEVKERLGPPKVFWEDQNIFVYHWEMVRGFVVGFSYAAIIPVPFSNKVARIYTLLIQFDNNDRVKVFEIRGIDSFASIGDHLTAWVKEINMAQPN